MIGIVLAGMLALTQYTSPHSPSVAVYGGVPLDLDLLKERSAGRSWAVEDCSTETLQCVNGHYYRLAVPRSCNGWQVGDRFESDGVRTDVLWTRPAGHEATDPYWPGPVRILGSADRPWVVYVYLSSTLEALYVDPLESKNLYQIAKDGGIDAVMAASTATDRYLMRLNTIRGLFSCALPSRAGTSD